MLCTALIPIVHKHPNDITIKSSIELRKICLYLSVTTFIDHVMYSQHLMACAALVYILFNFQTYFDRSLINIVKQNRSYPIKIYQTANLVCTMCV